MLYKMNKTTIAVSAIARDLLTLNVGDQIPTIASYIDLLGFSRGIVQDALGELQTNGSVILDKRGVKGSSIISKDDSLLFDQSMWKVIKGTMATPVNGYLRSLATAINVSMKDKGIPFYFSFIMGGEQRSKLLNMDAYDFTIVSSDTAKHFADGSNDLEIAAGLSPCTYSLPFALFVNKRNASGVEDGMTMCIDYACYDQTQLSYQVAAGKNVTFIEHTSVNSPEWFMDKKFDALVTRIGNITPTEDISVIPIDYSKDIEPTILTNKTNYRMSAFLNKLLNPKVLYSIQQEVLADPSKEQYEF